MKVKDTSSVTNNMLDFPNKRAVLIHWWGDGGVPVAQKTVRDKRYAALQGKLERLEKLCRALQQERNDLSQKMERLRCPLGEVAEPPDAQPDGRPPEVEEAGSLTEGRGLQPRPPKQEVDSTLAPAEPLTN